MKKPGVVKITIKGKKGNVKGAKQILTVYVTKQAVKKIKLNAKKINLKMSETYQLKATVLPKDSCEEVFYASSDESVASVSEDGKVTAVGTGRSAAGIDAAHWGEIRRRLCRHKNKASGCFLLMYSSYLCLVLSL